MAADVSGRAVALLVVALGGVLVTGCSGTPVATPETAEVTAPPVASPTLPGTTAGSLRRSSLPAPSDLGPRWSYRVDPGSAEDGYVGSGAPAIARDPADVLAAVAPLGCRAAKLPLPEHALEVTYRRGSTPGVGLLLAFDQAATAHNFFATHTASLRECHRRGQIDGHLVIDSRDQFVSVRKEKLPGTPTWTEGIRLDGSRALFVAVADSRPTSVLGAFGVLADDG